MTAPSGNAKGIHIDMKRIRQDLTEEYRTPGAYCQDYESFRRIFRFVERGLRRSGSSAYIILLTLTDKKGDFIALEDRERYMAILRQVIQHSVRTGDVFTQYSSCQFLLMVLGASRENALQIGHRIQNEFQALTPEGPAICLEHDVSPLCPVETGGPATGPDGAS